MQLSKNRKIFSQFCFAFAKSTLNFKYFRQKDVPQRLFLSEIIDWKKQGYLNGEKAPYQNTYGQ